MEGGFVMSDVKPCLKCGGKVLAQSRYCPECGAPLPPAARPPADPAAAGQGAGSRLRRYLIGALALVLAVGAVAVGMRVVRTARHQAETRSATAVLQSLGPVPDWLAASDPKVVSIYAWALEHHEELQYVPCYCGCDTFGHKNNSTCYFKRDENGKVTGYDEHAMT